MHANPFLIVVADGAAAHFYELPGPGKPLRPAGIDSMTQPNQPSRALTSDRPGRSFESASTTRHAVAPKSDPHDLEELRFSRAVAETIEQALAKSPHSRLVLVAAPTFLGQLRQALGSGLADRIHAELPRDLVRTPMNELPKHLASVLPVA